MKLYFTGHDCRYAVEQTMLTLFPSQRPEYPPGEPDGSAPALRLTLTERGGALTADAQRWWEGGLYTALRTVDRAEGGGLQEERLRRRVLQLAFYDAAVQALGREPPWGALTGVRPVKLPTRWMLAGESREQAKARLTGLYRVSEERAELALECAAAAIAVKRSLPPDSMALYVGVPFCPTRCAYCSFVSADVARSLALVEPYVDALCGEIELSGRLLRERGLRISAAYMGGGTPTTLSAGQLERVLAALEREMPMEGCAELTVEAGRPDTITAAKLEVLREHGVRRISINPQSMEDSVLRAIGREHTAAQIERAMELAGARFGGLVNMDLIAALPTDTPEGFSRTLDRVVSMGPENVTVHTLALKRGSRLTQEGGGLCPPEAAAQMLELARSRLRAAGYSPYYLYRQKYMSGSFENVGWCKPGTACAYNIIMMEELQSVLSLGGGGITKLVDPAGGRIERLNNPKFPREYLDNPEKIAADKRTAIQIQSGLANAAPRGGSQWLTV